MTAHNSLGGTWPGRLDSIYDTRDQNPAVRILRGDLTYSLWCTEGSEMILGEVGVEGGRLVVSGTAGGRAAARRWRMNKYMPISVARSTSPPMTPVENGYGGSKILTYIHMERTADDGTDRDRFFDGGFWLAT